MFANTGIQNPFQKAAWENIKIHSNSIKEKVLFALYQDFFWYKNVLCSHFKLNKSKDDCAFLCARVYMFTQGRKETLGIFSSLFPPYI